MQLGTTLAGAAVGAIAGDTQGAATGANAAFVGVTNNRLLHENEKQRIKELAKGDKELEEKLTRAACFEVKCWAQYPEGSAEWQQNFVSIGESIALANELLVIKYEQQTNGFFVYTLPQQAWDDFRSVPLQAIKNTGKAIGGGLAAYTGGTICGASGIGCYVGVPLATFGISEATEGVTGLYNQYKGNGTSGFNPLRTGFNNILPVWGDTAYDSTYLLFSALSLSAVVPVKIGVLPSNSSSLLVSDGIYHTNSMFGITASRWQNPILNPITGEMLLPNNAARGILFYGLGSKIPAIIDDVDKARNAK
jgi:filamentous hemagglutinin